MSQIEVPVKCSCSQIQGIIKMKPKEGNHVVCHCDDCQCFAHFLGKQDQILTKFGGTEIIQISPNRLKLIKGKDKLACVQLGPKGLKRWYASCCKTPIANTMGAKMPFNGIIHNFIDFESMSIPKKDAIGDTPALGMGKFAKPGSPEKIHPKFAFSSLVKFLKMLSLGFLSKSHTPNAFFDPRTNQAVVESTILSLEERNKLLSSI